MDKLEDQYHYRGFLTKAYPSSETIDKMMAMQPSLRAAWNWMCWTVTWHIDACEDWCAQRGLSIPKVPKPVYDGLTPDQSAIAKLEFKRACSERRVKMFELTKNNPDAPKPIRMFGKNSVMTANGFTQEYQLLNQVIRDQGLPELEADYLRALVKNWMKKVPGQKRKKLRKSHENLPIQTKSGRSHKLSIVRNGPHNAVVGLPRIGKIPCRVDKGMLKVLMQPGNAVIEGVSLREEYGTWWCSVKIVRRAQKDLNPRNSQILGIDPGLADLVTTDTGLKIKNKRNLRYADARQLALSVLSDMEPGTEKTDCLAYVYRQDAKQKRRVLEQFRQFASFVHKNYEHVAVEANHGIALGKGSRYTGATKTLVNILVNKMGPNRVHAVEPFLNSQICSECNQRSETNWKRKLGQSDQKCTCPFCGYTEDRDINAARNVKRKCEESFMLLAA